MKYVVKADKSNSADVLESIEIETSAFAKCMKAFGYIADYCFWRSGSLALRVIADESRDYQPKIYVYKEWDSDKLKFEIQTTSFGALESTEYEKFLTACHLANSAVTFLRNYDYSTFPEVEFEK